ncbi:glutathione S-transferase family protein [Pleomorphomonas sp. PLEO]|uniref:glutathione S-transferase family protein n=1 Tax=Pleomorphomonas sp. PLEO TaxID=3239306 RepID=UPI00351EFAA1
MNTLYVTRGSGNCQKPFLAFSQMKTPVRLIEVDVLSGATKSEAFRALNPLGVVPYLVSDDGGGVRESNAMLWLICDGSALMPETALERALSLQWMFFEQARLEPFISPARFLTFIAPDRGVGREADIEGWRRKAREGLAILNGHLADRDFMLGPRYGITDIALFGYVHIAHEAGIDMAAFPAISAWIERVGTTPNFAPLSALHLKAAPFSAGLPLSTPGE